MTMKKLVLIGTGLVLLILAFTGAVARSGSQDKSAAPQAITRHPSGNSSLEAARVFASFPLYFAGEAVLGLPLEAVVRINATPFDGERVRQDDVTFLYGSCKAYGDDACASPLQIQVWNACERYAGIYAIPSDEALTVRGVPASFYEDWTRLELYTSMVTIVVFGESRTQLLDVARSLRGVNRSASSAQNLPAPAKGVMQGALSCQN